MSYVKLWLTVYVNPRRFADELIKTPAPRWGFFAALQRGLMDSLMTYLPVYLIGKVPPTPSNLSFISNEKYYGAQSDIDQLLNISGFTALAIGSIIIVWDAFWLVAGGMTQYGLGISHLLLDIWAIAITTIALSRILNVPVWLGILLNIAGIAASMPFAIMFMRSPI